MDVSTTLKYLQQKSPPSLRILELATLGVPDGIAFSYIEQKAIQIAITADARDESAIQSLRQHYVSQSGVTIVGFEMLSKIDLNQRFRMYLQLPASDMGS